MLSDEERETIEQAISSVIRGVDIESAMLILEKCALDGLIITRGRINIFKIAVRQIVEFLKEYKDKGYLDVVREKVKANETVEKQSKEIEELKDKCKELIFEKQELTSGLLDSTPNDKIKAKIEELDYNDIGNFERRCKQEVLQSLLEEKE